MRLKKYNKSAGILSLLTVVTLASGCSEMVLMNPKGQIGLEQRSLIFTALGLMLIVVIPAIVMALVFTIKYRASNTKAMYSPTWSHSNKIELIVWTVPFLIIIFLANLTWKSTHALDPRMPIASNTKPLTIQVIAMDWKWLFIYPVQGIASVNEIAFPINVPVKFEVTSNSVMNSFFIPELGSQIYAMAGMNTTLYLIANEPGNYKGISSNFSGRGFSGMKFTAVATPDQEGFEAWVHKVKESPQTLSTIDSYEKIAVPSEYHPVEYFARVKPGLYQSVIGKFMEAGPQQDEGIVQCK
ncbi:cytochrome o ubiquinol oxidase subunit II [secondary endosymbiont of Ctenarytaina eucalypti]|uniref:Ubiquinol oxidase subunit 2 n=1 Tax=secondary endosymbiont of Ctenarytaina eucalypti TaxID=1199245 RepID=J3YSK9_9ENTR|nr:cytochrome o ubiquinol oxidase subunit II [secondary endosymbiont of Ctenarytaina eucalypti]AFP85268.1 cytochrome o ubiquinol oxidase subunit II [secondary endosymbiont of Ctenarytaina eucalypti]